MPSYKLTYYDVRYRPEVIRLMFHVKGIPFEDIRLDYEAFTNSETTTNDVLPLGELPVLEVDGHRMIQTGAIIRFVAREYGLYGTNNMEAQEIDEITETVDELIEYFKPWWYIDEDPVNDNKSTNGYLKVKGPFYLTFLEKKLEKSSSGFFIASSVTVADLAVCNIVDILTDTMPKVISPFTKLVAHKAKIQSMDAIARYLKVRPKSEI